MSEHDTILKVTGAAALTLAAMACTAGLAEVLRRGRVRRTREREHVEADRRHGHHADAPAQAAPAVVAAPVIPRQRQTGPRAETVRLTPAERDAFAGLVRRFAEDG